MPKTTPQPGISLILPMVAPQPRLEACLASWRPQLRPGDEVLLVCQGQPALERARQALAAPGLAGLAARVLTQPPGPGAPESGAGPARALGLTQARGEVLVFSLASCTAAPDLRERLAGAFADNTLAGLAGTLRPAPQEGRLAALAGLELAWQEAGQDLPNPACLALRRRLALEAGGLDPAWATGGGDLWELWQRLDRAGLRLEHDPGCQVLVPQPATWGALLARARRRGQEIFLRRRLGASLVAGPDHAAGQAALFLASLGIFAALWGPAPERAWSLAAICLCLLYPFNRGFINFVAQKEPPAVGTALLYCLLRPAAWTLGLLAGALRRLGGAGGGPDTING